MPETNDRASAPGPLRSKSRPAVPVLLIIAAVIFFTVFFVRRQAASRERISVTRNAVEMGTAVSITLYAEKGRLSGDERREQLAGTASRILASIDELDRNTLSWRSENSEIYRFTHSGADGSMTVSPHLAEVVRGSLEIARDSGSALDITLRPVIELWGIESYDGKTPYIPPSESDIEKAAAMTGSDHLRLYDEPSGEIRLEKDIPELGLDLGAVGKGYALDKAAGELSAAEVSGAVLAAGGSILTYGDKGEAWRIGLRDPEGSPSDTIGIISIPGENGKKTFISTSGGYEKYVVYEGGILGHIIDGRTMRPAENDLYSVTVVTGDSGLVSDALSTACYILGPEASVPLLESRHAEAVFVYRDKTVRLTDGLTNAVSLTDPGYSLAGGM